MSETENIPEIKRNNTPFPKPTTPTGRRKAVIMSLYGQSNAGTCRLSDSLVWKSPPFRRFSFMLDDINPLRSPNRRGRLIGWQGVPAPGATQLINLSEQQSGSVQTHGSAALSRLITWDIPESRRVGTVRSSAVGGSPLVGTREDHGLWRDINGNYTTSWLNWMQDIVNCHDLLSAQRYEVEAVYICFTHQEADWRTSREKYKSDFLSMKEAREHILKVFMPDVRVHWFVDQASGSGLRKSFYKGGAWPVRMAIQDAVLESSNITMVMPRYWMTLGTALDGIQDSIHHSYSQSTIN